MPKNKDFLSDLNTLRKSKRRNDWLLLGKSNPTMSTLSTPVHSGWVEVDSSKRCGSTLTQDPIGSSSRQQSVRHALKISMIPQPLVHTTGTTTERRQVCSMAHCLQEGTKQVKQFVSHQMSHTVQTTSSGSQSPIKMAVSLTSKMAYKACQLTIMTMWQGPFLSKSSTSRIRSQAPSLRTTSRGRKTIRIWTLVNSRPLHWGIPVSTWSSMWSEEASSGRTMSLASPSTGKSLHYHQLRHSLTQAHHAAISLLRSSVKSWMLSVRKQTWDISTISPSQNAIRGTTSQQSKSCTVPTGCSWSLKTTSWTTEMVDASFASSKTTIAHKWYWETLSLEDSTLHMIWVRTSMDSVPTQHQTRQTHDMAKLHFGILQEQSLRGTKCYQRQWHGSSS